MNLMVLVPCTHPPTPFVSLPNSFADERFHVDCVAGSMINLSYDITSPVSRCRTAFAIGMYMLGIGDAVV
jgi:hypothetical protein